MTIRVPYRDLYVVAGYDRTFYFTFEQDSAFVPPPLYRFPVGTTFRFRAFNPGSQGGAINISKESGSGIYYNPDEAQLEISFTPSDTSSATRELVVPFEADCVFPDGKKYILLKGNVNIEKTRNLLG